MRLFKRYARWTPMLVGAAAIVLIVGAPAAFGQNDHGIFSTTLTSFQETPTLSTNGHGSLRLQLGPDSITYTLTFEDLSSTAVAAHLHLGARGLAGGVFAFLCGGGGKPACVSPVTGTIAATDILTPSTGSPPNPQVFPTPFTLQAAERAIRAGAVYANVHTMVFPGGEIRGQLSSAE